MGTVNTGATETHTLTTGRTMTVTAGGSTVVWGYGESTGADQGTKIATISSTSQTFGPYATTQRFAVACTTGTTEVTFGTLDGGPSEVSSLTPAQVASISSAPALVDTSRALTGADNGYTLECTATVTLTVPIGLPTGFACVVIPSGTTSIASSGGALINGATATLTRAYSINPAIGIIGRSAVTNSYVITGT